MYTCIYVYNFQYSIQNNFQIFITPSLLYAPHLSNVPYSGLENLVILALLYVILHLSIQIQPRLSLTFRSFSRSHLLSPSRLPGLSLALARRVLSARLYRRETWARSFSRIVGIVSTEAA